MVGQTVLRVVSQRRRDHAKVAEMRLLRVGTSVGGAVIDRQAAAAPLITGETGVLVAEMVRLWHRVRPPPRFAPMARRPVRRR